jgi:hypothetical protein
MLRKLLLVAVTATVFSTPASALYTQCTAMKDSRLLNRPSGSLEPRFAIVAKGESVAIRDAYRDWWFVMHSVPLDNGTSTSDYGWLPRSILADCHEIDGTP